MTPRFLLAAVPAVLFLAGCDDMMMGGNTNTGVGAISADTSATTPSGIQAAQIAAPGQAGECERLALVIEDSSSTEVARQAAIEDRAEIGCPAL